VPAAAERSQPDLLLLDIRMPGEDGLQLLQRFSSNGSRRVRIVLLTSSITDAQAAEAMKQGVDGLMLKDSAPQVLLACVQAVIAGRRWVDPEIAGRVLGTLGEQRGDAQDRQLTAREKEIVNLVLRGLRNRQIADLLGLTEGTVKVYVHSIYLKFGVNSRMQLAAKLQEDSSR
jgi:two-component system nitrate/nitrite response regulator NarP